MPLTCSTSRFTFKCSHRLTLSVGQLIGRLISPNLHRKSRFEHDTNAIAYIEEPERVFVTVESSPHALGELFFMQLQRLAHRRWCSPSLWFSQSRHASQDFACMLVSCGKRPTVKPTHQAPSSARTKSWQHVRAEIAAQRVGSIPV